MRDSRKAVMDYLERTKADYDKPVLLETLRARMAGLLEEKLDAEFRAVFASWPGPAIAEALAVVDGMLEDGNSSDQTNTLPPQGDITVANTWVIKDPPQGVPIMDDQPQPVKRGPGRPRKTQA